MEEYEDNFAMHLAYAKKGDGNRLNTNRGEHRWTILDADTEMCACGATRARHVVCPQCHTHVENLIALPPAPRQAVMGEWDADIGRVSITQSRTGLYGDPLWVGCEDCWIKLSPRIAEAIK